MTKNNVPDDDPSGTVVSGEAAPEAPVIETAAVPAQAAKPAVEQTQTPALEG